MALVYPDPVDSPPVPISGTPPTVEEFTLWISTVMGVPSTAMPSSDAIQYAFDEALNFAYWALATVPSYTSPSVYSVAVYNLGADILVRSAQDVPGAVPPTFWSDLRKQLGLGSFVPGLITASADQGTSNQMMIPTQLKDMTFGNLLLMQTPWGRAYLGLVSSWGTIWGIT